MTRSAGCSRSASRCAALGKRVVASGAASRSRCRRAYAWLPGARPAGAAGASSRPRRRLLVTLDTGSADRLGSLADRGRRRGLLLVVDHHATNTGFGALHLVDPTAAATAVLVAELRPPPRRAADHDVAACLYAGLVTDTGSFRFAATTPETHELAARLLRTGIRHDLITRRHLRHPAVRLRPAARSALRRRPAGAGRGRRARAGLDRDPAAELAAAGLGARPASRA